MRVVGLLLAVIFLAGLLGCTTEEQSALTGGAVGAGAGAIIGHQSGHTTEGALIGGTAGLIGGYLYGKSRTRTTPQGIIEKYVDCPKCGATLQLPATATAGNKIKCGRCGTSFILR